MSLKEGQPRIRRELPTDIDRTQIDKFKEAARESEADDSEKRFDERLKRVAKWSPPKRDKPKDDKPGQ